MSPVDEEWLLLREEVNSAWSSETKDGRDTHVEMPCGQGK